MGDGGRLRWVPLGRLAELLERHGYIPDVPMQLGPGEVYHRFVPPLGARLPIIGVSSKDGQIEEEHFDTARQIVGGPGAR